MIARIVRTARTATGCWHAGSARRRSRVGALTIACRLLIDYRASHRGRSHISRSPARPRPADPQLACAMTPLWACLHAAQSCHCTADKCALLHGKRCQLEQVHAAGATPKVASALLLRHPSRAGRCWHRCNTHRRALPPAPLHLPHTRTRVPVKHAQRRPSQQPLPPCLTTMFDHPL